MTGRPSKFTPDIARRVIDALSEGTPLAEACRRPDMPHPSTVRDWARKDEALSLAIADAREDGEDRITADIRRTAKGDAGFSTGDVQRDKLVIDTDLKLLAKWNPKKYGDRQQIDLDAKHTYETLTDEQLDAEIRRRAAEAGVRLAPGGEGEAEA